MTRDRDDLEKSRYMAGPSSLVRSVSAARLVQGVSLTEQRRGRRLWRQPDLDFWSEYRR